MTIGKVVPDAPKDDGLQKGKIMKDFLVLISLPSFKVCSLLFALVFSSHIPPSDENHHIIIIIIYHGISNWRLPLLCCHLIQLVILLTEEMFKNLRCWRYLCEKYLFFTSFLIYAQGRIPKWWWWDDSDVPSGGSRIEEAKRHQEEYETEKNNNNTRKNTHLG